MAPKIPDRWIPYNACGDVIEGTRIICFKVPLHKNVQTDPDITKVWDIPAVLEEIPRLGAVIDLTNTARYYNPKEFEVAGVKHRKILMPGRVLPSEDKVQEFMDAVDEFLGKDCDSLVGVHCTHGLNRTGYMVCRYMRDRLKIPADEAIKRFEKARGYEIEREIYSASLLDKSLTRPDFGKETVIKPIDNVNGVKSSKHDYDRHANVNQNQRYKDHDRYYSDRYGSNNSYSTERNGSRYYHDNGDRSKQNDDLFWRSRDEASSHRYGSNNRYSAERNGSRYYHDNGDRSKQNDDLTWRSRDEASNHSSSLYSSHNSQVSKRSIRSVSSDSSDRSSPERSNYSYKHDY